MMGTYTEDDFLMLSGVQHYAFCPRQWCLIHLEQLWDDNVRTLEGSFVHENAHDPFYTETKKGTIISRALPVHSFSLGLSGECDVVEFRPSVDGFQIDGYKGKFVPYPIEYKRGSPKQHDADILQLVAQAVCLEETFGCEIKTGALFYWEIKKREEVEISKDLRDELVRVCEEMHSLVQSGNTVRAIPTKGCNACSIKELCVPKLAKVEDAKEYNQRYLGESNEKTP